MSGGWTIHLMVAPILLPLVVGALLLFVNERRRRLKAAFGAASSVALLLVAAALLRFADLPTEAGETATGVYLLGNWPAPFGIVLVVDRLSALMLLLTAVLALPAQVFALGRWHRAAPHFHSLFQFLLMGVNGAFLTGDLFNLFVFFEVMLAASYGLVLHGSGRRRVKAGMHYIVINLVASFFLLIGVALIYGVTGTLNMADLAVRIPAVAPEDRMLLEAGAAILGIAFLTKAGMWPLNFWLPTAYAAAAAPVAAMFAILTKVGVYILLRLSLLLFGEGAGAFAGFGADWLTVGGMLTVVFGTLGVLAARSLGRLTGYCVLVSSGTVLAAIGIEDPAVAGGALFYLVSSTVALSALFLLVELLERDLEQPEDEPDQVFADVEEDLEDEEDEVGVPVPATLAVLGLAFIGCTLLLAGLPPLGGFLAKFVMLGAVLNPGGPGGGEVSWQGWLLVPLLIISGLATLIAMMRAGIRRLWAPPEPIVPRVLIREAVPVAMLLFVGVALTVLAEPVMRYMTDAATALHAPTSYVETVLGKERLPGPRSAPSP
ncbi:monovalent cation/H+ antiporter subunit D [Geminicoccus flavidas]|uniref:monovalent cation/H+ antiporter subunit D n=1 Tax=Geminicoccus flavidas TaxID=2506407 RepID=UPI00135AA178|nr:monovalent cation/H+ antiporter subunit D [Geminicoccus flavidas]